MLGRRRPAALSAPHLQHRGGHPPRRGARCGAQVLPAHLPGVLRAPPNRTRRRRAAAPSASATSRPLSAPICCSPHRTCPASCCTSKSARTCSCRFRPARKRRWRARRCWPTCPAALSRSAAPRTVACWPARRRRGAWPPTSTPPQGRANRQPTWPGTARPWFGRTACCSPNPSASPRESDARVADVDIDLLRAERLRMGTFDDNRRHHRTLAESFRRIEFPARPAGRRHRTAPRNRALPVRAGRSTTPGTGLL